MRREDRTAAVVYALLVCATFASWETQGGHGAGLAAAALLGIASFKSVLIGLEFMELKRGPVALRAIFTGWAVLAGAMLIWILWMPR